MYAIGRYSIKVLVESRFLFSACPLIMLLFVQSFMKISQRVSELLSRQESMVDSETDQWTSDYCTASAEFFW